LNVDLACRLPPELTVGSSHFYKKYFGGMSGVGQPLDLTVSKDVMVRMDEDSASLAAQTASRDDEFYLTDEMTVFLVENRLFRVHRHFLAKNSPLFGSMFSLPQGADEAAVEGTSDANPIYLSGVTEFEFQTLLRYFYKGMRDGFSMTQKRWIALLSIAHRYEFLKVRKHAIREIYDRPLKKRDVPQQKSGVDAGPSSDSDSDANSDPDSAWKPDYLLLITMAEEYDVPLRHVLPYFVTIVMRDESLRENEVMTLSAPTVCRLSRAREKFMPKRGFGNRVQMALKIVCDIWLVGKNDV